MDYQTVLKFVKDTINMTPTEYSEYIDEIGVNRVIKLNRMMVDYFDQIQQDLNLKDYLYFITFTTRPETQIGSQEFLQLQAQRRGLNCKDFVYTVEHPQGNKHYHVLMRTSKPIVKSDFRHWETSRGYIDFKPVKDESTLPDILAYMSKESELITIKGGF